MAYHQDYVRASILYEINNVEQFSINLTWVLKAFGTNWNDGATVTLGEDNSLESFINHYTGWLAYNFYDETDVSRTKYPETNQFLTTSKIYNQDFSDDDIIVDTFMDIWRPLDTVQSTVVFSETQKNAVAETGKAIYAGDLDLVFVGPPTIDFNDPSFNSLWEFIWDRPFPNTPSNAFLYRLGIAKYILQNTKASLGVFYLKPEYINSNKASLTGNIKTYTTLSYPYSLPKTTVTRYVDTAGNVYTSPADGRVAFDYILPSLLPNLNHNELTFFGTPKRPYVGFYDSGHNYILQATLTDNNGIDTVWESATMLESYYKNNNVEVDYYRNGDNDGVSTPTSSNITTQATPFVTDLYNLNYPASTGLVYDSRNPDASNWAYHKYIDNGVYQESETSVLIKDTYQPAYADGTFKVIDGIDDGYLEITVPGITVINDVSAGTENLTDALSDNGNYTADDTSIIKEPGSTVEPTTPKEVIDPGTATVSPKVNIAVGFMTTYLCNETNLQAIGQKLYDPTVIEAITKAFTDPIKLIRSLAYVPFKVHVSRDLVPIMVGNYDMQTNAYRANSMFYDFSYGVLDFTNAWGNTFIQPQSFRSYDEYAKYAIYVPFIGYQQLTANDVMGHKIRLDCQLNIVSGDILVTYWVDQVRRYIWGGNCMFNLPVTDRDFLGGVGAIAGIGAAVAAGIATGGSALPVIAAGAAATAGAVGSKTMAPQYTTSGQLGGQLGIMGPATPFIIQERMVPNDSGYNFFGGNLNLSGRTGYFECINPVLNNTVTNFGLILEAEYEEIKSLMSEGIWIK